MPAAAEEAADGDRPGLVGLLLGDANGSEAENGIAELEAGGGVEVGSAGVLGGGEPDILLVLSLHFFHRLVFVLCYVGRVMVVLDMAVRCRHLVAVAVGCFCLVLVVVCWVVSL